MNAPSRTHVRVVFAAVLLLSGGTVAGSYATTDGTAAGVRPAESVSAPAGSAGESIPASPAGDSHADDGAGDASTDGPPGTESTADGETPVRTAPRSGTATGASANATGTPNATERGGERAATLYEPDGDGGVDGLTVVATQGFYVSDETASLVAFDESGEVAFYESDYRVYFDVDPVAGERYTVEHVAARHLDGEACADVATERCTYNVVRRVNLTTGEHREVYAEVTPQITSGRWHDVDRINDTHLAIADIVRDSVRIVDVRTGETTWSWHASALYDPDQGGNEGDWTHLNDVEVLDDGRLTASVRNMDEVVFLDPGSGADANWTLGTDDDHATLYEQHNPDYVPEAQGGPAVVVADSENGRVLEYQRENGTWERSWGWRDSRLQWPRDADRLPNGNTLVTDTHGDRVVEVTPNGSVAWSVTVGMPYEAERLGTGDESAGGPSAAALRNGSDGASANASADVSAGSPAGGDRAAASPGRVTDPGLTPVGHVWIALKDVVPSLAVNGLLFAAPAWVRFPDLVFVLAFGLGALSWGGLELYWSRFDPLASLRARLASAFGSRE